LGGEGEIPTIVILPPHRHAELVSASICAASMDPETSSGWRMSAMGGFRTVRLWETKGENGHSAFGLIWPVAEWRFW